MLWLGIVLFLTAATVIGMVAAWASESKLGPFIVAVVGILLIGFFTLMSSIVVVESGEVGVVYSWGSIIGQKNEGASLVAPWQDVKTTNIQVQKKTFDEIAAASKETQNVYFKVTINWSVNPNKVQTLFREVGPDYFDKLVESRVNSFFKDETVQYEGVVITQKRDEIREAVRVRLSKELEPFSIYINDMLIDNIWYSPEFDKAIEEKQVATQNSLRAQELVKQREYEAQQTEAIAQGQANALRITAEGQAQANRLLNESLTDEIIRYQTIQKLSDNITIMLVPDNGSLFINPSELIKK